MKSKDWLKTGFGKIISYFLQGLLLVAPTVVTVYAIYYLFNLFDDKINDVFEKAFHLRVPGFGVLIMFLLITFIGFIGSAVFIQPILHIFDLILEKTPVVKDIYSSLKDFFEAFISNKKKFNKPVMFEITSGSGVYRLGFITQNDLTELGLNDKVAVYCPLSYNLSGILYIVNRSQVQVLNDVPSGDVMKFIVTGGVSEIDDDGHHHPTVVPNKP